MLVLHKLPLVEGVKVPVEGLCHDGFNIGLAGLRATVQLEGLVGLLVGRLKLELLRLVVCHTQLSHS
jgi:hypothetical protein